MIWVIVFSSHTDYRVGQRQRCATEAIVVSGVATNTQAGVALIEKLCGLTALNLLDYDTSPRLKSILKTTLSLPLA